MPPQVVITEQELDPAITPEQIQKRIAKRAALSATCEVVTRGAQRFLVCKWPRLMVP